MSNRAPKRPLGVTRKLVVEASLSGKRPIDIARHLSITPSTVTTAMTIARALGELPPKASDPTTTMAHYIRTGSLRTVLLGQPKHVHQWVIDNMSKGTTLAEFAVSLIVDAANEDFEKERSNG